LGKKIISSTIHVQADQGVTTKSVVENSEEKCEFVVYMGEDEDDGVVGQSVDIGFNEVHEQVKDMQNELTTLSFTDKIKISSTKEHSNTRFEKCPTIIELKDDEIYELSNSSDEREVQVLRNLNLKIGKIFYNEKVL
jgi:DNA phosphorothioation-dependent restriction protein DptG